MGGIWSDDEKHYYDTISLSELKRIGNSGDILLFSGSSIPSVIISAASYSTYSHVGILIKTKEYGVCVWESSPYDKTTDIITGFKHKDGPRLVRLEESIGTYLSRYHGNVVTWRQLILQKEYRKTIFLNRLKSKEFQSFLEQESRKKFEDHKEDMVRSLVPLLPGGLSDGDPYARFCTELVAVTLMRLGVLDLYRNEQKIPPDNYTVTDFEQGEDNLNFKIVNKYPVGYYGKSFNVIVKGNNDTQTIQTI